MLNLQQLLLTDSGLIPLSALRPGDTLLTHDDRPVTLDHVEVSADPMPLVQLYDFGRRSAPFLATARFQVSFDGYGNSDTRVPGVNHNLTRHHPYLSAAQLLELPTSTYLTPQHRRIETYRPLITTKLDRQYFDWGYRGDYNVRAWGPTAAQVQSYVSGLMSRDAYWSIKNGSCRLYLGYTNGGEHEYARECFQRAGLTTEDRSSQAVWQVWLYGESLTQLRRLSPYVPQTRWKRNGKAEGPPIPPMAPLRAYREGHYRYAADYPARVRLLHPDGSRVDDPHTLLVTENYFAAPVGELL